MKHETEIDARDQGLMVCGWMAGQFEFVQGMDVAEAVDRCAADLGFGPCDESHFESLREMVGDAFQEVSVRRNGEDRRVPMIEPTLRGECYEHDGGHRKTERRSVPAHERRTGERRKRKGEEH